VSTGPTQRAADKWDSAAFSNIFLASGLSCSQAESRPAHLRLTQTVRRLRSPFKKRGEAPRRTARRNPLHRRRRYAFALSPHKTINNRKRRLPGRKTRSAAEPADEPDLAVSESAHACGKRKAQTLHRSFARPARQVSRRAVRPHWRHCIEEVNRMNSLVTTEKLTDALEVSASELLK